MAQSINLSNFENLILRNVKVKKRSIYWIFRIKSRNCRRIFKWN